MSNVLERICEIRRKDLIQQKEELPLSSFIDSLIPSDRSLRDSLSSNEPSFILECKKASPSKGLIREDFRIDDIISAYKNSASAISVLTEVPHFQGSYKNLEEVRRRVIQPVLNKDFFVDPYQVHLARYYKADAILLMLSVLSDVEYFNLARLAASYQMDVLTEVSNREEVDRALALGARIIGINNRNLRDLSTNLSVTTDLAPIIRKYDKSIRIVSESGIYTHQQVKVLCPYVDGFLVGSSIMAQKDLSLAVKKLIVGEHKVCGLTRPEDAKAANIAGAAYGGLIFTQKSPRYVSEDQARAIVSEKNMDFVGVFVNASIDEIVDKTQILNLSVIQLHGDEGQEVVDQLRKVLPDIKIWKAHNLDNGPLPELKGIDRWLLDSGSKQKPGGTGKTFDWSLIDRVDLGLPYMLAGGLSPNNAALAAKMGAIGLDLNSGVESKPGLKDHEKIRAAFAAIQSQQSVRLL